MVVVVGSDDGECRSTVGWRNGKIERGKLAWGEIASRRQHLGWRWSGAVRCIQSFLDSGVLSAAFAFICPAWIHFVLDMDRPSRYMGSVAVELICTGGVGMRPRQWDVGSPPRGSRGTRE